MTQRAGRFPAVVATACPVGSPRPYVDARSARHSARIAGPPRRWIAPSTPPPPSSDELAALTIASTCCSVISPWTRSRSISGGQAVHVAGEQCGTGDRGRHDEYGTERN